MGLCTEFLNNSSKCLASECSVPRVLLSALCTLAHFIFQQRLEVDTVIFQVRLRERNSRSRTAGSGSGFRPRRSAQGLPVTGTSPAAASGSAVVSKTEAPGKHDIMKHLNALLHPQST